MTTFTATRGGLDRRAFLVDGTPLKHWSKDNFQPERDESCRVVYTPKEGSNFFRKSLRTEDFIVMRNQSAIEQPFFSKYNRFFPKRGHFCCKGCGNPLYSYKTKIRREDGYPAFGTCIDGAIGMTTAEQRRAKAETDRVAATRIQAFYRGCHARAMLSEQIGKLIEKVMELQRKIEEEWVMDNDIEEEEEEETKREDFLEEDLDKAPLTVDRKSAISSSSRRSLSILSNHWSVHLLNMEDGDSSSSSFDSFGNDAEDDDDDDDELFRPYSLTKGGSTRTVDTMTTTESELATMTRLSQTMTSPTKTTIASSVAKAAVQRKLEEETNKVLEKQSAFNDLLIEIHCHRCKSHLGNVYEETCRGIDGITMYKERHRVNGRALKYVEDDLPKRVNIGGSLLFASTTQARLLGLKAAEPIRQEPEYVLARRKSRDMSFMSPISEKKKNNTLGSTTHYSRTTTTTTLGNRPGVGPSLNFQSPERAAPKILTSTQRKIGKYFLNQSVH